MIDEFDEYQLHQAGMCTGDCYYCREEDEAFEQRCKNTMYKNRIDLVDSWER